MPKFTELPVVAQLGIAIGLAAVITAGMYYFVDKDMIAANADAQKKLDVKLKENEQLKQYEGRKVEMEQRIAGLQQQLETLNRIVPSEKEAPQFMQMVQGEAMKAGIEIRRYTAQPTATREFFTEVPWYVELDGPYYSILNFFERVAKLDRIINISGMKMSTVRKPGDAGLRKTYTYAPNETVVVSCTATTFFSRENQPAAPAKK